jgi:hypothetical protein
VPSVDLWDAFTHRLATSIDPKPALAVVAVAQPSLPFLEWNTLQQVPVAVAVPTGQALETDKLVLLVHSPLVGRAPSAQTVGATMQQAVAVAVVY